MSLKKPPWNVLVFPAASEIGIEIGRSLGQSKEVILHGAAIPGVNAGSFHFKNMHELPSVYDDACLPALQKLIAEHKIDAVFPAYDDVVLWLAERAGKLGAEVITSPLATCKICRSKRETYHALEGVVPVPQMLQPLSVKDFPVFAKPDRGQGSQRARRIDSRKALEAALAGEPDLVVMEHLPGREYTVDCFSQRGRGVLFAQARERLQTKAGIATLTRLANLPYAREWAERIAGKLDLLGAWFFQIKEDAKGEPRLLEVAPRLAGSMALSRVTGPNFALLSLYEAAGYGELHIDSFAADITMSRSLDMRFSYDRPIEALYIDFDDTLILRGKVNTRLVALIFQCRNRGIPVNLLTHHPGNLDEQLRHYRLTNLFDRIIHLPDAASPKALHINEKNAVLIDDSFRERAEVARRWGIRCFDAAGAICLIDDRN